MLLAYEDRRFRLHPGVDPFALGRADAFPAGDLGLRKPSAAIYQVVIERLAARPQDIVFVDDRPRNLDAAAMLGFRTVLLDVRGDMPAHPHRNIRRLADLL